MTAHNIIGHESAGPHFIVRKVRSRGAFRRELVGSLGDAVDALEGFGQQAMRWAFAIIPSLIGVGIPAIAILLFLNAVAGVRS